MDAVTQVLVGRMTADEDAGRMFGASLVGHAVLFAAVLLVPASWMGAQRAAPESVMTVSLAGPQGPQNGGRRAEGGRPVQVTPPPEAKPEPQRPPAAATPEMVEPVKAPPPKAPPKAPPPKKVEAPREATARTAPATGPQVQRGDTVANTRGAGFGGLTSGAGGTGAQLDVGDFCCPQYLATMQSSDPERMGEPAAVARHHHRALRDPARRDDDQRGSGAVERQCHARPDRHPRHPAGAAVAAAAGGISEPVADHPHDVRVPAMTPMPRAFACLAAALAAVAVAAVGAAAGAAAAAAAERGRRDHQQRSRRGAADRRPRLHRARRRQGNHRDGPHARPGAVRRPVLRARVPDDPARHLRLDSAGEVAGRRALRSLARARRRRAGARQPHPLGDHHPGRDAAVRRARPAAGAGPRVQGRGQQPAALRPHHGRRDPPDAEPAARRRPHQAGLLVGPGPRPRRQHHPGPAGEGDLHRRLRRRQPAAGHRQPPAQRVPELVARRPGHRLHLVPPRLSRHLHVADLPGHDGDADQRHRPELAAGVLARRRAASPSRRTATATPRST